VTLQRRSVLTADNARLHLEGSGPPKILMLHGLGYASWEAQPLRKAIGPECGLWSLDNRGTGRSEHTSSPTSITELSADAAQAIESLGGPLTVLGHSMGGYTAQTLARSRPDLVNALILIATSSGGTDAEPVPQATLDAWSRASGLDPAEYARRTMPLSFSENWPQQHPKEFEHILSERSQHPTPGAVWRHQFDAAQQFLKAGIACDYATPTVIIHGSADRIVPVANGQSLARQLPNAEYHEFPGVGHLPHLEKPETVAQIIRAFMTTDRTKKGNHHARHRG